MAFSRFILAAILVAVQAAPAQAAYCDNAHSNALCCMGVLAPFYTNSYVWGSICGVTPADQNELVGGRCIYAPKGDTDQWYV
jgi:hypothetical protein